MLAYKNIFLLLFCSLFFLSSSKVMEKDTLPRIIVKYNNMKIYDEVITRDGVRKIKTIEIDTLSDGIFFYFVSDLKVLLKSYEIRIKSKSEIVFNKKQEKNSVYISLSVLSKYIKINENYKIYVSLENGPFVHFMNLNTKHILSNKTLKPSKEGKFKIDTTKPFSWN
jgi:hypothetical protein